MVWQGGLLGRPHLLPHEHHSLQLFCANWKNHNTMAFTTHPTDPKASQREEPCSVVSPRFHCTDNLECLQRCHQHSGHCKHTAEQASEYRASTNCFPHPKRVRHGAFLHQITPILCTDMRTRRSKCQLAKLWLQILSLSRLGPPTTTFMVPGPATLCDDDRSSAF